MTLDDLEDIASQIASWFPKVELTLDALKKFAMIAGFTLLFLLASMGANVTSGAAAWASYWMVDAILGALAFTTAAGAFLWVGREIYDRYA